MVIAVNDIVEVASKKSKNYGSKAVVLDLEYPGYKPFTNPLLPNVLNEAVVGVLDSNNNIIKNIRFSINSLTLISRDTSEYDKFTDGTIVVDETIEKSNIDLGDDSKQARTRTYGQIVDAEFHRDEDDGYRCIKMPRMMPWDSSEKFYNNRVVHVSELRLADNEEIREYEECLSEINKRNTEYIVIYNKIVTKTKEKAYIDRIHHYQVIKNGHNDHVYHHEYHKDDNYDIEKDYFKINGTRLEDAIKDMFSNEEVISNSIEVYELGEKKKIKFDVEV